MTTEHTRSEFLGTLGRIREQVGTDELVSTAQDRATVQVGGKVFERAPWERDSKLIRGGVVVEIIPTEDGEADVLCLSLRGRHGAWQVKTTRLHLSDCTDPEPRYPSVATLAGRRLLEVVGQRQSPAGPDLDRWEARYLLWSLDLLGGLEAITTIAREI